MAQFAKILQNNFLVAVTPVPCPKGIGGRCHVVGQLATDLEHKILSNSLGFRASVAPALHFVRSAQMAKFAKILQNIFLVAVTPIPCPKGIGGRCHVVGRLATDLEHKILSNALGFRAQVAPASHSVCSAEMAKFVKILQNIVVFAILCLSYDCETGTASGCAYQLPQGEGGHARMPSISLQPCYYKYDARFHSLIYILQFALQPGGTRAARNARPFVGFTLPRARAFVGRLCLLAIICLCLFMSVCYFTGVAGTLHLCTMPGFPFVYTQCAAPPGAETAFLTRLGMPLLTLGRVFMPDGEIFKRFETILRAIAGGISVGQIWLHTAYFVLLCLVSLYRYTDRAWATRNVFPFIKRHLSGARTLLSELCLLAFLCLLPSIASCYCFDANATFHLGAVPVCKKAHFQPTPPADAEFTSTRWPALPVHAHRECFAPGGCFPGQSGIDVHEITSGASFTPQLLHNSICIAATEYFTCFGRAVRQQHGAARPSTVLTCRGPGAQDSFVAGWHCNLPHVAAQQHFCNLCVLSTLCCKFQNCLPKPARFGLSVASGVSRTSDTLSNASTFSSAFIGCVSSRLYESFTVSELGALPEQYMHCACMTPSFTPQYTCSQIRFVASVVAAWWPLIADTCSTIANSICTPLWQLSNGLHANLKNFASRYLSFVCLHSAYVSGLVAALAHGLVPRIADMCSSITYSIDTTVLSVPAVKFQFSPQGLKVKFLLFECICNVLCAAQAAHVWSIITLSGGCLHGIRVQIPTVYARFATRFSWMLRFAHSIACSTTGNYTVSPLTTLQRCRGPITLGVSPSVRVMVKLFSFTCLVLSWFNVSELGEPSRAIVLWGGDPDVSHTFNERKASRGSRHWSTEGVSRFNVSGPAKTLHVPVLRGPPYADGSVALYIWTGVDDNSSLMTDDGGTPAIMRGTFSVLNPTSCEDREFYERRAKHGVIMTFRPTGGARGHLSRVVRL